MGFIISIVFLFIAIIVYAKNKKWYHPVTLVLGYFTVICFGASVRLFDLSDTSLLTWGIVFLGLVGYVLGTLLKIKIGNNNFTYEIIDDNKYAVLKEKVLVIVIMLCYLIAIVYLRDIWVYLQKYGLAMTRMIFYDVEGYAKSTISSTQKNLFLNFIYVPMMWALRPISVYLLFWGKNVKNRIKLIISLFGLFVLEILITGGRMTILIIMIQLLAGLSMAKKISVSKRTLRKIKYIVGVLLILGIIGMIYSSISRGSQGVFYTVYQYLCMCIPHLSYRIEALGTNYPLGFGIAGFYGFLSPIFTILAFIGIPIPEYVVKITSEVSKIQEAVVLGGTNTFNAFVTPVFRLYIDFGVVGVFLGMILIGVFFSYYFRKHTYSNRYRILYIYIIAAMLRMNTTYPFSDISFVIGLFYVYCLTKKDWR